MYAVDSTSVYHDPQVFAEAVPSVQKVLPPGDLPWQPHLRGPFPQLPSTSLSSLLCTCPPDSCFIVLLLEYPHPNVSSKSCDSGSVHYGVSRPSAQTLWPAMVPS